MPGRPDFSIQRSQGDPAPVATSNRKPPNSQDVSQTDSVASGSTEVTEVYAPTGKVWDCRHLRMEVQNDSDATTGGHTLSVASYDGTSSYTWVFAKSNYNTKLSWWGYEWQVADKNKYPASTQSQVKAVEMLKASENIGIRFEYSNSTDVAQENERKLQFLVEESEV